MHLLCLCMCVWGTGVCACLPATRSCSVRLSGHATDWRVSCGVLMFGWPPWGGGIPGDVEEALAVYMVGVIQWQFAECVRVTPC